MRTMESPSHRLTRLAVAAALCLLPRLSAAQPAPPPNVLVILADDMGIGDVSALNARSLWQTPNIDRLAREGMIFTDAHSSASVCTPTRYTLLTGRYSWRGALKQGTLQGYSPSLLERGRLTLPGFLRTQGYVTAMFGKWHLGLDWTKKGPRQEDIDYAGPVGGGPVAHGFDRFFGISASLDMPPYVWLENDRVTAPPAGLVNDNPAPRLWRAGPIGGDFRMEDVQPRLTEKTIAYLAERGAARDAKPFFLYLALAAPHTPTLATTTFAGTTPTPYGDFVRQVDADIGRILAALEEHGLARNTLVIFTSDNGYAPAGNIPNHLALGHDSTGGYRGSKSDSFEGGHRIPFIARWPGVTPAGSRCPDLVGQFDLFATMAEALGARLPDTAAEDSSSMLALLRGRPAPASRRDALVHHSVDGEFSIRQGQWKLILAPGSGGWSPPRRTRSEWSPAKPVNLDMLPPFQLYDLTQDPKETTNLAGAHPEIVQRLGRLMRVTIERGRSTPGLAQPYVEGDWPQTNWRKAFEAGAPPKRPVDGVDPPMTSTPQGLNPAPVRFDAVTPAPLFRDPVYDGAADPVLVWNPGRQSWWLLYTQRRAKLDLPGVEWCHGTEIGVAESRDEGMTWSYLGMLGLEATDAEYSFWAPDVIRDESGRYHLFVSYVPGAASSHRNWGGQRHILHYSSDDLSRWAFAQRVPLASDYCIDPTLILRPDGAWRMWYKDEGHGSKTHAVESRDLRSWTPVPDPGVSKLYGEGPKAFRFGGYYWLIKDPNSGLDVYRSDELDTWTYQGKILDKPGTRNSDGTIGKHADVVVVDDRAYIIYFTHPYTEDAPERNGVSPLSNRHTALQAAELAVQDGRLVCDRDRPFRIHLTQPPK